MQMIRVMLMVSLFSLVGVSAYGNTKCLNDAKNHLAHIAEGESVDKYSMKVVTPGPFAAEPSVVYHFFRSIVDSWEIELTESGCFPVRIEFVGDL